MTTWYQAGEAAARSLCVVLAAKPVGRSWPFMVGADAPAAGKRSAAAGAAGEVQALPDGNHGDNTVEVHQ